MALTRTLSPAYSNAAVFVRPTMACFAAAYAAAFGAAPRPAIELTLRIIPPPPERICGIWALHSEHDAFCVYRKLKIDVRLGEFGDVFHLAGNPCIVDRNVQLSEGFDGRVDHGGAVRFFC